MIQSTFIIIAFAGLVAAAQGADPKESFCGVKEPEQAKTCISVRLPWQEAPIYFCTEKANLKYRDRCTDRFSRYCPMDHTNTTLLVATPWDCCPISSTPDFCSDAVCPPKPFNRTCKEIAPDTINRPWDCCPTYFCEEGDISMCQIKRLKPDCVNPPKNKKNCIAFRDDNGCCYKYQCEGEGKPGMCPAQAQANHFKNLVAQNGTTTSYPGYTTSRPIMPNYTTGRPFMSNDTEISELVNLINPGRGGGLISDLRCIGDHNCPGQMKCCSTQMSSYLGNEKLAYNRLGHTLNDRAIYGMCVEPTFSSG